jgi:glutamate 5-kinase
MKKKIIGIKLGSATLVEMGKIREEFIKSVCTQIAKLINSGYGVFIVTSGAVASDVKSERSKNLRSAVGQPRIMQTYAKYLGQFGLDSAQLLLTDEQLIDAKSVKTKLTKKIMHEALSQGVVPIINANDVIDSEEVDALRYCADNDKLFKLMCLLVDAEIAIIGFDQVGFLDAKKRVLHNIKTSEIDLVLKFAKGGSKLGHGKNGMRTKIISLSELAKAGMRVHLAPAKEKDFILRSVAGEENFGTKFLA